MNFKNPLESYFQLQPFVCETYSCGANGSEKIPATNICDGKQDCDDGDDEDPKLCEGDKSLELYGLIIILGYFVLGCLTYLIRKLIAFYSNFECLTIV